MSDLQKANEAEGTSYTTPRQLPLREQKWVIVMAACIAGAMIGYGLAGFAPKPLDWKHDAAQHHALYRGWTIVSVSPDQAGLEAAISTASKAIGAPLSLTMLTSEKTLELKYVQVLGVGDSKLAQFLYAASGGRPIALYAMARSRTTEWTPSEMEIETAIRSGLASATWATGEAEFLLIGGDNMTAINALARNLRGGLFRAERS